MDSSVEIIKRICRERKIAISKLERECGFSNGYIRSLREGKLPYERLEKVADYLGLSIEYLATGKVSEEKHGWYLDEETARAAQEVFENPETRLLFDAARDAKPEDIRLAAEMLKRMKETNPDG